MSYGFRRGRLALALAAAAVAGAATAGSLDLFGIDMQYQLQATYAAGVRVEKPADGIIDTPPAASIPIPTYLKFPESANYDDGDRNFRRWSLVNNRLSLLGELLLQKNDYGVLVRGDAFYDNVYRRANDNDSPGTINKYEQPNTAFTDAASYYDGKRARVLDAYAFGTWMFGDSSALNLRIGRQVVAWGESLFFDGVALSQGPADAAKATVPGADVKSILLPVNQISMQFSATDKLTLLGQYKLQYEPVELNPVGEFFSVADVVGPGREFIWGIRNPLYLPTYENLDLTGSTQPNGQNDLAAAAQLALALLRQNGTLPPNPLTPALQQALDNLTAQLDKLGLNVTVPASLLALGALPGTPKYINPQYAGEIRPSNYGQYGLGARYALTPSTTAGLYYLRYHDTIPSLVQNYGDAVLIASPAPGVPDVTTAQLGIKVPVTYNVKYFDGVKLAAASLTTTLFGANIGAEAIYRRGIPVLVNAFEGILGPVPSPARARVGQLDLNALYVFGPTPLWDALTMVADVGANRILSWDGVPGVNDPAAVYHDLKYSRDAWAYYFLSFLDYKNIFSAWDLQIPISFAGVGSGHSSLISGFGSLMGEGDYRASIAFNFTHLQRLSLGVGYNAFIGRPDFTDRPYQDRDYVAVTATYRF